MHTEELEIASAKLRLVARDMSYYIALTEEMRGRIGLALNKQNPSTRSLEKPIWKSVEPPF